MVLLAFFIKFRDRVLGGPEEYSCRVSKGEEMDKGTHTVVLRREGVLASGPSSLPEGRTLVLGGTGRPAGCVGRTQGEREGAPDIWWIPQLVQLLAEELSAVRPHLLVKDHLQQLCQT